MSCKSQEIESKKITVGIDATNLRQGGSCTHLVELLHVANPDLHEFSKIIVWGNKSVLTLLNDCPWLKKVNTPAQEKSLLARTCWQRFHLSRLAREFGCDILFVPGGNYLGDFHPVITMSRNMLPFEWKEMRRYGMTLMLIRLIVLHFSQSRTFQSVDGVIFLTQYAKSAVEKVTGSLRNSIIIPHGINDRFKIPPRIQKPIQEYSENNPFLIIYVSIIDHYKHQWNVVHAIAKLRKLTGWNLKLDLVGLSYPSALARLHSSIKCFDSDKKWVRYYGAIPFDTLHEIYAHADLGIFASSCENMPNILLETMAAGLPIACSNLGPMPEILGQAGVYFNPENPQDMTNALKDLIASPELRTRLSNASYAISDQYSWKRCANDTYAFLKKVALKHTACAG